MASSKFNTFKRHSSIGQHGATQRLTEGKKTCLHTWEGRVRQKQSQMLCSSAHEPSQLCGDALFKLSAQAGGSALFNLSVNTWQQKDGHPAAQKSQLHNEWLVLHVNILPWLMSGKSSRILKITCKMINSITVCRGNTVCIILMLHYVLSLLTVTWGCKKCNSILKNERNKHALPYWVLRHVETQTSSKPCFCSSVILGSGFKPAAKTVALTSGCYQQYHPLAQ